MAEVIARELRGRALVGGRYAVRSELGRGGMSTVYLATDTRLGREVALKLLSPALADDLTFVERFRREAQAAAGLNHPNIVTVYDWGEHDGTYYIAMEYVPGSTLKDVISRRGARPESEALAIGAEVAAALEAAHARGVIHRDIKPHNVLLDPDGNVKVTDFGIARATGESQLTDTGTVLGSAHYASPEQIQHQPADPRSDVYSLGAVLFELLAGRPPFMGESPMAIAWQHVHEAPPPLANFAPAVTPAVERLVAQTLAKDRAERFQSAAELRRALLDPAAAFPPQAEAASAVVPGAPPVRFAASAGASADPYEAPTVLVSTVRRRREKPGSGLPRLVAAVAGLAAVSFLALMLVLRRGPDDTITTAAPASPAAATSAPTTAPTPAPAATPVTGVLGTSATAEPAPTALPPTQAATRPALAASTQAPPPAAQGANAPAQAVTAFYEAISSGQLDRAAALWSPRMQAQYPPTENVYARFAQTHQITVHSARVVAAQGDTATVAVEITEVIGNPAVARRWVGTWGMVRTPAGWLLDSPNLVGG